MAELGPDAVAAAVDDTLADLRTTYLDLLLIHWPLKFKKGTVFARDGAPGDFREAWAAMEALVDAGKVPGPARTRTFRGDESRRRRGRDVITLCCLFCARARS